MGLSDTAAPSELQGPCPASIHLSALSQAPSGLALEGARVESLQVGGHGPCEISLTLTAASPLVGSQGALRLVGHLRGAVSGGLGGPRAQSPACL